MYCAVFVAGMTLGQVKCPIENHLGGVPDQSADRRSTCSRTTAARSTSSPMAPVTASRSSALPRHGERDGARRDDSVQGLPAGVVVQRIWVARAVPGRARLQPDSAGRLAGDHAGRPDDDQLSVVAGRSHLSFVEPFIAAYNYIDMAGCRNSNVCSACSCWQFDGPEPAWQRQHRPGGCSIGGDVEA